MPAAGGTSGEEAASSETGAMERKVLVRVKGMAVSPVVGVGEKARRPQVCGCLENGDL